MMLEQSLISPNFLGKESFRWFIGLVTQYCSVPDTNPEKVGSGFKAKVRIIGYHPDSASVISDDELPWAHVLVPLNMGSGSGGNICYNVPKGGETVLGFFIDGDDGQQPVIIGSLGTGYTVEHSNDWNAGTNGFIPFKQKTTPINSNNRSSKTGKGTNKNGATLTPNVENKVSRTGDNGEQVEEKSQGAVATENNETLTVPPVCKTSNSNYSKIVQSLRKFIRTLNTIQQIQNGFIAPLTNTISNIPGLVQELTTALTDLFSEYIKKIRDAILKDVYKWLEDVLNSLLPKDIKIFKQLATDKIADSIWCVFSKLIKSLTEFVFNFITQLIGAITNIPICAAEAFVGSIMTTINNEISDALSPILSEFASSVSGTIGNINNYIFQALNYANQALNFLSCEGAECKQVFNYEMNKGYIPQETIDNVQRVLNYPSNAIANGKEAAKQWLGIVGSKDDESYSYLSRSYGFCDAINLNCGLPTIQFFGGAGSGAIGSAVVDALGQVMGINILNGGTGYSNPPYVTILDPCNNGTGAQATAVIDDNGSVIDVIIDNPGSGYLNGGGNPCTSNPVDENGSEIVGYISKVNIIKTGVGYTSGDSIFDTACTNDIEIYPVVDSEGRIIDVNIVNPGTSVRVFPQLEINTPDGEGAVLQPILKFNPVDSEVTETNKQVQKVILCAEDHDI
jgi:hypothetical protein